MVYRWFENIVRNFFFNLRSSGTKNKTISTREHIKISILLSRSRYADIMLERNYHKKRIFIFNDSQAAFQAFS